MRTDRRAVLLTLPVALTVLVGCTASAPTETAPPKFDQSINEVRDTSIGVVDSMVEAFPGARRLADTAPNVYPCPGEDPSIGR